MLEQLFVESHFIAQCVTVRISTMLSKAKCNCIPWYTIVFVYALYVFNIKSYKKYIGVGTEGKVGRLRYMVSAVARAYNGGLGAEPPAGSRGRVPGQGVRGAKPP